MRLIHVKLEKIRNKLFVKIPELIAEALHLKEGEEIEISIHSEPAFAQGELWGDEPEEVDEIDDIYLEISEDLHTLNMYNRIYVRKNIVSFFHQLILIFSWLRMWCRLKPISPPAGILQKGYAHG